MTQGAQRETRQRKAIRRVFLDSSRPLTPEEVQEAGQRDVPGLGIATVYRNVKLLSDEGWLAPVELPGSAVRYELSARPHHHHFVCTSCDQAYDVHGCPPSVESMAPEGFTVDSHEIILYGVCPNCG
mgnify:CR=1 FL=1